MDDDLQRQLHRIETKITQLAGLILGTIAGAGNIAIAYFAADRLGNWGAAGLCFAFTSAFFAFVPRLFNRD